MDARNDMKIQSIPKSGRQGDVVFVKGRCGNVVREFVPPSNPRTADQQAHRQNILAVSRRWRTLSLEQEGTWRVLAANTYFLNDEGERVRLNCFKLFVSLNTRRADLGLPQFDVAPPEPVFDLSPVLDLDISYVRGKCTIKLRVDGTPEQLILVQGAKPVRSCVRFVLHFPFLGLLPPPINGWSNITEMYVARFGVPKPGTAVWIRTCQHIDGFIDASKALRFRIPASAA
jgi:hypothetical protein